MRFRLFILALGLFLTGITFGQTDRPAADSSSLDFKQWGLLAIQDGGQIAVYDTGDHKIFGVAQAQSHDQTLTFSSQSGLVRVSELPKVDF